MRRIMAAAFLVLAACARDETIYSYGGAGGDWQLQRLNGNDFPAEATLRFDADGKVSGTAPCNRFSSRQTVPYPWIAFDPVAATKRACPELSAEQQFFEVLDRVSIGIVDGDTLTLSNDEGDRMVFTRTPRRDG